MTNKMHLPLKGFFIASLIVISGCGGSSTNSSLPSGKLTLPYILSYQKWCGVDLSGNGKGDLLLRLTFTDITLEGKLSETGEKQDVLMNIDSITISDDGVVKEDSINNLFAPNFSTSSDTVSEMVLNFYDVLAYDYPQSISFSKTKVTLDNYIDPEWYKANPILEKFKDSKPTVRLIINQPTPPPPVKIDKDGNPLPAEPVKTAEPLPPQVDIVAYPCRQISPTLK